jgi:hypothetical protein
MLPESSSTTTTSIGWLNPLPLVDKAGSGVDCAAAGEGHASEKLASIKHNIPAERLMRHKNILILG